MTRVRTASHAGSWYSSSASKLNRELSSWLDQVVPGSEELPQAPIKGCKAIIAPHAGYSYSGPTAAWAYKCVDVNQIKRVFILGPSHHVYLDGCALSNCDEYATPLGNLKLDQGTIAELRATGKFDQMSEETDEDEHSIEMHLPYVRKIFEGRDDVLIVPILVGSISTSSERAFGSLLSPYLSDPSTLFVVSSDFCHWGTRFNYTYYLADKGKEAREGIQLSRSSSSDFDKAQAIDQSIEQLDRRGMECISFGQEGKNAKEAHERFSKYLKETKNTICGRHPIGVLLAALSGLHNEGYELVWTRYDQSERVKELRGSSVSYASAFVRKT